MDVFQSSSVEAQTPKGIKPRQEVRAVNKTSLGNYRK